MKLKIDKTTIIYIIFLNLVTFSITVVADIELITNSINMTDSTVIYIMFLNIMLINLMIISVPILLFRLKQLLQKQIQQQ